MTRNEAKRILAAASQNKLDQLEEQATAEYERGKHGASDILLSEADDIRTAIELLGEW